MGASEVRSKDSSWTIRVVPTLAPSIAARAGTRPTTPPAAKPVIIRPVAVLLCSAAVMPRPAAKARRRVPSARPRAALQGRAEGALHAGLDHVHAPEQQGDVAGEVEQGDECGHPGVFFL